MNREGVGQKGYAAPSVLIGKATTALDGTAAMNAGAGPGAAAAPRRANTGLGGEPEEGANGSLPLLCETALSLCVGKGGRSLGAAYFDPQNREVFVTQVALHRASSREAQGASE